MPTLMPPSLFNSCWRELVLMLDLLLACIIVQVVADGWLWALVSEYESSPLLALSRLTPSRLHIALIFTAIMLLFIAYRTVTGKCLLADRAMFVLGCGVVAGFVADILKFLFGRSYPGADVSGHLAGYHPLSSGAGLGSFPSGHAAIAAGVAASLAIIWPAHRRTFVCLASLIAATRFVSGVHYPSDVLLGFATGLGVAVVACIAFYEAGIELQNFSPKR
jgi:membrane-associated phospholipid phosphatase